MAKSSKVAYQIEKDYHSLAPVYNRAMDLCIDYSPGVYLEDSSYSTPVFSRRTLYWHWFGLYVSNSFGQLKTRETWRTTSVRSRR